jgi:biofilm protein TabA
MKYILRVLLLPLISLAAFICLDSPVYGQSNTKWNKKSAERWFKAYPGLTGLNLKASKSIDKLKFAAEYQANQRGWDKAFAFMKTVNPDTLKPGNYPIDGENVIVRVTEGSSKDLDSVKWEAHKNYHDIHYDVYGKEKIGIGDISKAKLMIPYDPVRDISFYEAEGRYYVADPETFFIIFSSEVHRPLIRVKGYDKVKKIVIKVRTNDFHGDRTLIRS